MATSPRTTAHSAPEERSPLRLELRGPRQVDGVDGAWWPQTRDLQVETADLIDHFPETEGRIHRVLFSRPDWDDVVFEGRGVRRVQTGRGPVKVGSFPGDDTHQVVLTMAGGQRLTIAVVPCETSSDDARRAMQAAVA